MAVPLFASSLEPHHDALAERLEAVARSGRYILGPEVAAFEEEFASYLGVRHCVGVANGTDGLTIALRALGVQPGDEVVLPSFTFYATAEAAVNAGAVPVFCDVDPATGCVTRETVERVVTPRTRAIVPVHLFGNVAPVDDLAELGLPVLEDSAQAAGAARGGRHAGALGDAATFSFFPSKNLPCLGDGGAIVTDSDDVADRARRLRFHGSADKETFDEVGYNSRLDELQAAALRVLLPELDGWTEARRAAASAYVSQGLGDVPGLELPQPVPGSDPAYHLYVTRHEQAETLVGALAARGIGARGYYRLPAHLQPAMERFGGDSLDLPGTAELARTNLALPMGTQLGEDAIAEVVEACRAAAGAGAEASAR
ncbi:MAG: DegT/DnrJ/EryC1/StrS family aminotransferase [Actinobacteria bacterium]|nr:MAG: DegT/DnrJ/EryC1/StrS family aminotransferase [Actinomycetota bacterium]